MKDQYFGDVNDFRKYGLLRMLTSPGCLRLGVCWMLTENDARTDGNFRSYLDQPQQYRYRDPELFDWLKQAVVDEGDRRTSRIEASGLLGNAVFQARILTDSPLQRSGYFRKCKDLFSGCDLVFFDPDNGLEVQSCRPGKKNSCKYLFWDEVRTTFAAGSSVLIYQHFPREERYAYSVRKADILRQQTGASAVFSYRTPHVLFLLASQKRHAASFRKQLAEICLKWGPNQIVADEQIGASVLLMLDGSAPPQCGGERLA